MSVNRFKNGVLQKIAGAVGDAVPLINNFLTNQPGKGAADANTVYTLKNEIDLVNNSLTADNSQLFQFAYDETTQKYGYKVKEADTDVFVPFNGGATIDLDNIKVIVITTNETSNIFQTTIEDLNANKKYLIISQPTWSPTTTAKIVDTDGEYVSRDLSAVFSPTVFIVEKATYITLKTIMSVKNMSVNVICFEM